MKRNILQTTLGVCVASLLLVGSTASAEEGSSWADSIKLGGDLRFRHERIDQDGKVVRTRQRIRARLSLSAEVDEDFDVHMRLASGSDDPVSTNSTLGSGFSTKDFGLDLAYFDWNIEKSDFHLMAGKMKQPFYVVKDLIYDSDLNPEGGALQYDFDLGGTGSLIATAAGWWGEERSSDSDTMMWGGQLLADLDIAESAALETGVSYYYWDNTKGFDPLFDSGDSFGNSTMTDLSGMTVYANDFGIINPFAKLKIDVGMPLAVYADVAINTQEDTAGEDTAWMVGATLGKAKEVGSWQADYNYRNVEADSIIGAFTDSDSGGGGTDISGHRVQFQYQIKDRITASATLFVNELGIASGATSTDYNRIQIDLIAKL